LLAALLTLERGDDVYGWWLGARDAEWHSAYFRLAHFYSSKPTRLLATEGMDLYGGWKFLYNARHPALDRPEPVDDDAAHELDRAQALFAAEWLVFEDDPDASAERAAYEKMGLPLGHVAIRSKRLGKLDERQAVWIHRSHGFDANVLETLQRHWPLDYRAS
jgi:hypothetical protein